MRANTMLWRKTVEDGKLLYVDLFDGREFVPALRKFRDDVLKDDQLADAAKMFFFY